MLAPLGRDPRLRQAGDRHRLRAVEQRPAANATVVGLPRLAGLDHHYVWRER